MNAPMTITELAGNASMWARLMRSLSHPARLVIACKLVGVEMCVGDLEQVTGVRQPTLSRELAKMRANGLLRTRRQSKAIFYSIADPRVRLLLEAICQAHGPVCSQPQSTLTIQE